MCALRLLLATLALALVSTCCGGDETKPEAVVVPLVTQRNVIDAYDLLHEAGLRVAIPVRFQISALWVPGPRKQFPRAGARVPRGTVVTLQLWGGPLGSPRGGGGKHTLPDFAGKTAREAVTWVDEHRLFWEIAIVPPLPPSDAPHLLDAYVVTQQSPVPGSTLGPGIIHVSGGFEPTPVRLTIALAGD